MECMVVGLDAWSGRQWVEAIENQGEDWRCLFLKEEADAWERLRLGAVDALVLMRSPGAERLLARLADRPPLPPPYLLCDGWTEPWADGRFAVGQAAQLAEHLQAWEQAGRLPALCLTRLEEVACLARSLLMSLGVRPGLRAMEFLPDLLGLCTLHPALLRDLSGRLYPLCARRNGLSAPQVERRLRLAVESTWNRASLVELDRFFGHSVDPERGKPTNKEFLCRLAERLTLAGARWDRAWRAS